MFEINVLFSFVTDEREKRLVVCNNLNSCFIVMNEALKTVLYYNENEISSMYTIDHFMNEVLEDAYYIDNINDDYIDRDYLVDLISESDTIKYKQMLIMQIDEYLA